MAAIIKTAYRTTSNLTKSGQVALTRVGQTLERATPVACDRIEGGVAALMVEMTIQEAKYFASKSVKYGFRIDAESVLQGDALKKIQDVIFEKKMAKEKKTK